MESRQKDNYCDALIGWVRWWKIMLILTKGRDKFVMSVV
jgi:hypothetical protein